MTKVGKLLILSVTLCLVGCDIHISGDGVINIGSSEKEEIPETMVVTLPDQMVEGLQITNFNIVYENGLSSIAGMVINTTQEVYQLKQIMIRLYDKNDKLITTSIAMVGNIIDISQAKTFNTTISQDLRNVTKVEYEIEK